MANERTISFSDESLEEVTIFASNADKIAEILSASSEMIPTIGTVSISRQLAKKTGIGTSIVRPIANNLVRLHRMCDDFSATPEEIANIMLRNLEKTKKAETATKWKSALAVIVKSLTEIKDDNPLVVSFLAGESAREIPNYVCTLDITTDARPIFTESKDRILFTTIRHVLSIGIHDESRQHKDLTINLDAGDIEMLRDLCDSAEKAAATLKAATSGHSAVIGETYVEDSK